MAFSEPCFCERTYHNLPESLINTLHGLVRYMGLGMLEAFHNICTASHNLRGDDSSGWCPTDRRGSLAEECSGLI